MKNSLIIGARSVIIAMMILCSFSHVNAQKLLPFKLPDSGQSGSYSSTAGEDADYFVNPLSFTNNGNGTITDNNTGLVWQKSDGGEMTFENAVAYCNNLVLGGFSDWRLPGGMELFSINDFDHLNPALDTVYFTKNLAEYWWTSEKRADDSTKVWVVNAGGGIGAHPKTETLSAGGTKRFHVRAVRYPFSPNLPASHFTDNGDGTISDHYTGLVWQKIQAPNAMSWEAALVYSQGMVLAGTSDWRLPDIKELQSINDVSLAMPSFNHIYFPNVVSGNYWSSTTMQNTASKAWDLNVDYGIVSYNDKTILEKVLLVRGGQDNTSMNLTDVLIPGGEYEMGDHFGFVDPGHPSDETPVHTVKVDSFFITKTEVTNQQFLEFLNASYVNGLIQVQNHVVRFIGDTNTLCYTSQYASYYSISFTGNFFTMADYRAYHPMVGVMWHGAAAFCNWLSTQNALQPCYTLLSEDCDFTKNGYRLPTEAEWEYAARGGHYNPYFNYPTGDSVIVNQANLPGSADPYEGGTIPLTTPAGFYDGTLKQKTDFNWPGNATTYQTTNGANTYGLYDMQGNVWEMLNDWYGQNYYSVSTYDNPQGPATGFLMPDGKPYHGMRGGNWYNGLVTNGINNGHSRVSNRNPCYYRGPQDPNHPWYHVGFRVARKYSGTTGIPEYPSGGFLFQNYPNPFNGSTTIQFFLKEASMIKLEIFNSLGQRIETLAAEYAAQGMHTYSWDSGNIPSGMYSCVLSYGENVSNIKMVILK